MDVDALKGESAILAILRELVEPEHAAKTDYCRCSYCQGLGHWTPEFVVEHAPDCPIFRGRVYIDRFDRQAESR